MDYLSNDLVWLLSKTLPDGVLSVLSNEFYDYNNESYFTTKDMIKIKDLLDKKKMYFAYIYELIMLQGPSNLRTLRADTLIPVKLKYLTGLIKLEILWLTNHELTDITSLSELINLEELFLSTNLIQDISRRKICG